MSPSPITPPGGTEADVSLSEVGEFGLIERMIRDRRQPPSTLLGPGDDAAVLAAQDGRVVVTTDVLVQGVHFRLDWSSPEQVGRKAAAVNLADVVAMGAVPTALLLGLSCPASTPTAVPAGIADGMWTEAVTVGAGVVGGDVSSAPAIVVAVTALGSLEGRAPVTRSGARPGDVVAVVGRIGWAAAGLAVLGRGFRSPGVLVDAQRVPQPPYAAGPAAARAGATSMIDVSDGLLADLAHVARASGVRIALERGAFAIPYRLGEIASALGADPLDWMLTGGEDHALAATFAGGTPLPEGFTAVGRVEDGDPEVLVDGEVHEGEPGWRHFPPA